MPDDPLETSSAFRQQELASDKLLRVYRVRQAAIIADIHPDTIRRWIREGRIPGDGRRGCLRVSLEDLLPQVQPKKA